MTDRNRLALVGLIALAIPATVLAMQSGSAGNSQIYRTYRHAASQIYEFGGTPVKLNTATGAIHSLQGDAGAQGTGGYWKLNVPAVGPGMYEIQRTSKTGIDGVFLVDAQSGATWLLRWRGNKNGAWYSLRER